MTLLLTLTPQVLSIQRVPLADAQKRNEATESLLRWQEVMAMDATIVRIMKTRKRFSHTVSFCISSPFFPTCSSTPLAQDLVSEVRRQLSRNYQCDNAALRTRIEVSTDMLCNSEPV